jgi:hypothetical protein
MVFEAAITSISIIIYNSIIYLATKAKQYMGFVSQRLMRARDLLKAAVKAAGGAAGGFGSDWVESIAGNDRTLDIHVDIP